MGEVVRATSGTHFLELRPAATLNTEDSRNHAKNPRNLTAPRVVAQGFPDLSIGCTPDHLAYASGVQTQGPERRFSLRLLWPVEAFCSDGSADGRRSRQRSIVGPPSQPQLVRESTPETRLAQGRNPPGPHQIGTAQYRLRQPRGSGQVPARFR